MRPETHSAAKPARSPITTHILDLNTGLPASNIQVILEHLHHNAFQAVAHGKTNADGRVEDLLSADHKIATGTYKIIFATGDYFKGRGETTFYPIVEITFNITDVSRHHHVPLLLSPFGYSTYRGS